MCSLTDQVLVPFSTFWNEFIMQLQMQKYRHMLLLFLHMQFNLYQFQKKIKKTKQNKNGSFWLVKRTHTTAVRICSPIVKEYCNVFYMHCYLLLGHDKKIQLQKFLTYTLTRIYLVTITMPPYRPCCQFRMVTKN